MKNILKYIFIGVMLCGFGMIVFAKHVHANALPQLDPQSWSVIDGEGGAYTNVKQYSFFGANPETFVFGVDQIINQINNDLYSKYGWDLETASWQAEDYFNSGQWVGTGADNFVYQISDGQFNTYANAIANGYQLFHMASSTASKSIFGDAKQWILGKLDTATNTINSVINNAVVKITPQLLASMGLTLDTLQEDDVVKDTSNSNLFYGNSFTFTNPGSTSTLIYNFNVSQKGYCFYIPTGDSNGSQCYLGWLVPYDSTYDLGSNNSYQYQIENGLNSGYRITNGTRRDSVSAGLRYQTNDPNSTRKTVIINGVTYIYGRMYLWDSAIASSYNTIMCGFSYSNGSQSYGLPTISELLASLQNGDSLESYSIGLSPTTQEGSTIDWANTLEGLLGKYVPTSKLQELIDIMNGLANKPIFYPNPGPNGDIAPLQEVAPTDNQWQLIIDKIDELEDIAGSIALDIANTPLADPLPEPEPEPEPEPNPNTPNMGITIPDNFPTDPVFNPLTDIVSAPFDMLSIFKPIFALFGVNWLLPLWLLIPPIIIIVLIIKSLL